MKTYWTIVQETAPFLRGIETSQTLLYLQDTAQKGEAASYSRLDEMVRWYVEWE